MRTSSNLTVGLIGSFLLCAAAWLSAPQPWGLGVVDRSNPMTMRLAHTIPSLVGMGMGMVAWLGARSATGPQLWQRFWMWATPLVVCPPLFSRDAWAYLEQGWIVVQGFDPYRTPLGSVGGPFAAHVDAYWIDSTTVYPPLALAIQAAVVAVSFGSPLLGVMLMRLPGLLAVVATGLMVPRIARAVGIDERDALWWAILNPLVLAHAIGGAHNDMWAVALAVAGLWIAVRHRGAWWWGCVLVGLAVAVKQPLGLWLIPVAVIGIEPVRRTWTTAAARLGAGLVGVGLGFALPTLALGWGIGWATGSGTPQSVGSQSLAHTTSDLVRIVAGIDMVSAKGIVEPVFLVVGVIAMGWLLRRHGLDAPLRVATWGLIVFAVSYPSLQPWYLLWGGMLIGLADPSARATRWLVGGVAAFATTSVLIGAASLPIPVAQAMAIAVCVLVARTRITATDV